jgi:hypothetical protein
MIKKISIILSSILLLMAMSTLLACSNKSKSIHDIWDMRLSSDGQTIEVFGLTAKGEQQAREGNGVFDFPTEVNGKTKFFFKGTKRFGGNKYFWDKFSKVNGIIFGVDFQSSNLSFDDIGSMRAWGMFEGRQEHFFADSDNSFNFIIFRENGESDFKDDENWTKKGWIIYKENIIDNNIVHDPIWQSSKLTSGMFGGYIFNQLNESGEISIVNGITEIALWDFSTGVFGKYAKNMKVYRVPKTVKKIKYRNILRTTELERIHVYVDTEIEPDAFAPEVEIIRYS